jgi:hypothetical protein
MNGSHGELRLEGFDTTLKNHRVLLVGEPEHWLARLAQLESESLYKGRTILVIQESPSIKSSPVNPLLLRRRWDCVFRVKEMFEAQMLATYVGNAPKPVRVVWLLSGGQEIPRALVQKWSSPGQQITLMGCMATDAPPMNIGGCEWEAILFPLRYPQDRLEKILAARGSGLQGMAVRIRDHMSDIAGNGAAILWSNIEEGDSRGSLYWYDPSEGESGLGELYTKKEAAAVLEGLSKWLAGGGGGI